MSYIPVFCAMCARTTLADEHAEGTLLACGFCERTASPVVGPAYGEQDLLAFAEIERAVAEAVLQSHDAQILSSLLQRWLDEPLPPHTIIHQLLARLPVLVAARGALFDDPKRAVGMLLTTIGACAGSANRQSGAFLSPLFEVARTQADQVKRRSY
jgi:hypothetical protein